MNLCAFCRLAWVTTLCLVALLMAAPAAVAQYTLDADGRDLIKRLDAAGNNIEALSRADQARLFANNDAINAARLNGEISDASYQAAQKHFAAKNESFAKAAAEAAGAEFTVQQRPANSPFSPGTDSDYITVVKNKDGIAKMQSGYNDRVNDYMRESLQGSGEAYTPKNDWQKKLDTDFMADPRHVSADEFRDIAKMNNDAYKNRFAADFERISRTGDGGKISTRHVSGYAGEMIDFTDKKSHLIDDMFKNPAQFNDPRNRAKVFQRMAQEQKYTSRLEALDDYLRNQEGLPPRNRAMTPDGKSIAAKGAMRDPKNVDAIRDAHAATAKSRNQAIADLTESIAEAAKNNPDFARTAAVDDLTRLVDRLPPAERSAALDALKQRNPNLGNRVAAAIDNLPSSAAKGASSADDLARATGQIDDAAKAGLMRKGLDGAIKSMEVLGRIATAADVASAASRLKDYLETIKKATWDPSLTNAEADALFEKASGLAKDLMEAGGLGVLMEASPAAAAAWGTWTLTRHGGEWILNNTETGQSLNRAVAAAMDDLWRDWEVITGQTERSARQEQCNLLAKRIREGRIRVTYPEDFKVLDLCNFIKVGIPIDDLIEIVPPKTATAPAKDQDATGEKVKAECDAKPADTTTSGTAGLPKTDTSDCAAKTGQEAAGEDENATDCAALSARLDAANERYEEERGLVDARAIVEEVRGKLDGARTGQCPEVRQRAADASDKIERMRDGLTKVRDDLRSCEPETLAQRAEQLSRKGHAWLKSLGERARRAIPVAESYQRSKEAYAAGDLEGARSHSEDALKRTIAAGGTTCVGIIERINSNLTRIAQAKGQEDRVTQLSESCDKAAMRAERTRLAGLGGAGFYKAMGERLDQALVTCKAQETDATVVRSQTPEDRRAAVCRRDFGEGYVVGHVLEDGRFFCKPTRTTADKWCVAKNGAGHHAADVDQRGGFKCLPTQATANAWCNRNNAGSGWTAGAIRADGSYSCHMSDAGQKAAARAECEQKYGSRLIRVYKSKGRYYCEYQRPEVAQRQPKSNRRRQPDYDAAAQAAAAAAIANTIAQGINASRNRPNRAQRRCHRNPYTGAMHCGSN